MADKKKPQFEDSDDDPDYRPSIAKKGRTGKKRNVKDEGDTQPNKDEGKEREEDVSSTESVDNENIDKKTLDEEIEEKLDKLTPEQMEKIRQESERKGKPLTSEEKQRVKEKEAAVWAEESAAVGLGGLSTREVVRAAMYAPWMQLLPDPLHKVNPFIDILQKSKVIETLQMTGLLHIPETCRRHRG
jgi:hypothetical protein